ncbi:MAG: DNA internalization-related competence protein ComEC/Rec2 [Fastidiosipilaceae bacterium]
MESKNPQVGHWSDLRRAIVRRPMLFPACGGAAGSLLAWGLRDRRPLLLIVSFCVLLFSVLLRFLLEESAVLAGAACFLLVTLVFNHKISDARSAACIGDWVTLRGTLTSISDNSETRPSVARVIMRDSDRRKVQLSLPFKGMAHELRVGDEIELNALVQLPEAARNPGGFAEDRWLAADGVYLKAHVSDPGTLKVTGRSRGYFIDERIGQLRAYLRSGLSRWLGEQDGALTAAMLYGDVAGIDRDLKSAYQAAGLSHLMAVSGSNVSAVTTFFTPLLIWGDGRRKKRIIGGLAVLSLFAFVTGWEASVTRAVVTQSLGLISALRKRRVDRFNHLLSAVALMTLAFPPFALRVGFWMSVAVTGSILTLQPRLFDFFSERSLLAETAFLKTLNSTVSLTVAATLGSLPFTMWLGARLSPLSPLLNVAATPLAAFVTTAGLLLGMISAIPVLPQIVALSIRGSLFLLNGLAALGNDSAGYGLWSGKLAAIIYSVTFALTLYLLHFRQSVNRKFFAKLSVLLLIGGLLLPWRGGLANRDTVWFFDVGQGDAVFIQSGKKSILIDAGTSRAGEKIVLPALRALGVRRVDLAICTHLDEDHVGGMISLIEAGMVGQIGGCSDRIVRRTQPELYQASLNHGCDWLELVAGDKINVGDEMILEVIWPFEHKNAANEDSVVSVLTWHEVKILLTGDIGVAEEEQLLDLGMLKDLDVLQVAHHGSKHSTGGRLLDLTQPELSVIQVGRYNSYGHPAEEVLRRLEDSNCEIFRTDECGAVWLRAIDGRFDLGSYLYPKQKIAVFK